MANIEPLPTQGQRPWDLNPAIRAINNEVEGRLSDDSILNLVAGELGDLNPEQLSDAFIGSQVNTPGTASRTSVDSRVEDLAGDTAIADTVANRSSNLYGQLSADFALKGEIPSDVVKSFQVSRIVAVPEGDAEPPLLDGDLLIRYAPPGTSYFKDFASDTLDTEPSGMTKLLDRTALVKSFSGARGGKVLEMTTGSATCYALTALGSDPDRGQVEVLSRWFMSTVHNNAASVYMYVDTATDSMYRVGYTTSGSQGVVRAASRTSGTNVTQQESFVPQLPLSSWCRSRMRIDGPTLRAKTWVESSPEPDWQLTVNLGSGAWNKPVQTSGIASLGSITVRYDWLSVATGGRTAGEPDA